MAATQDQFGGKYWNFILDNINNPDEHDAAGKNYTDWRLPTLYELKLMYAHKAAIGNFWDNFYWSSCEADVETAWALYFFDGKVYTTGKH